MSDLPADWLDRPLSEIDPEIAAVVEAEVARQQRTLEMIASENFAPRAIMEAQGSVLTNKYAEGYPGKRYYGGCEEVDVSEQLAIDRAKELFGAEHANVQPHSGAQANAAVYHALLNPGDTILGLELAHGGHLSHGMKLNMSGKLFDVASYGVDPDTFLVDMDVVASVARERKPKLIIAGWSAYPRHLDFAAFREIADEVGAKLLVDMAHFAGLVAAGEHPSPVPYADVVTSTVHKSLAGPRAGFILCKEEWQKKIDSGLFPGLQGGPLCHGVAGKAVAFGIAATPAFKQYQKQICLNAQALADGLLGTGNKLVSGGTDTHLVLLDLQEAAFSGKELEDRLHSIHITVNRNSIPFDPRPAMETSGIRIGTPAATMRGLDEADFANVGRIIGSAVSENADLDVLRSEVDSILVTRPLYAGMRGFSSIHAG